MTEYTLSLYKYRPKEYLPKKMANEFENLLTNSALINYRDFNKIAIYNMHLLLYVLDLNNESET